MENVEIGVKILASGSVAWVMTPEFEETIALILDIYTVEPDVIDEVRAARRHGGRHNVTFRGEQNEKLG